MRSETSHFVLSASLSSTSARTSTTTPTTTSTSRATSWASRSSAETSCTSSTARTRTGGRPTETASGPRRSQVCRADYKFPPLSMRAVTLNTNSRSLPLSETAKLHSSPRSIALSHPSIHATPIRREFISLAHPSSPTLPFPSLPPSMFRHIVREVENDRMGPLRRLKVHFAPPTGGTEG